MEVGSGHDERIEKWLIPIAKKVKESLLEEVISELVFGGRL